VKDGFAGYFLIVSDFIHGPEEPRDPRRKPGRGFPAPAFGGLHGRPGPSPISNRCALGCVFERFLTPERVSDVPDFYIDFCQNRRDEVDQIRSQAQYGLRSRGPHNHHFPVKLAGACRLARRRPPVWAWLRQRRQICNPFGAQQSGNPVTLQQAPRTGGAGVFFFFLVFFFFFFLFFFFFFFFCFFMFLFLSFFFFFFCLFFFFFFNFFFFACPVKCVPKVRTRRVWPRLIDSPMKLEGSSIAKRLRPMPAVCHRADRPLDELVPSIAIRHSTMVR